MTKDSLIQQAFEVAAERYAAVGVDVRKALEDMKKISLSLHCWQADDVSGFENQGGSLTGGIQVTGNYPGRARTIDELRRDVLKAKSYIPGNHRLSLHEIYGDFQGEKVDRDEVEPHHFESWIQWAKENDFKLDFNSTSFSHPKSGDLTLANPSDDIRNFWIEHTKRCRWISDEMGKAQNDPCMMNLWIHDGSKEVPASRLRYRRILEESLDEIFATEYKWMKDCIEAKLFGIGLESYTVGSYALLEPIALLRQYEDEGKYFQRLALQEEAKSLPWGAVWDMYCLQSGVPVGESYIAEIEKYESDVTSRRQ